MLPKRPKTEAKAADDAASKKEGAALEQRDYTRRLVHNMLELRIADPKDKDWALFRMPIQVSHVKSTGDHQQTVMETKTVSEILNDLINVVWRQDLGAPSPEENATRTLLMKDIAAQSPEVQSLVVDVMAHAGQLYQMAGLLAREKVLSTTDAQKNPIRQLLFQKSAPDAPANAPRKKTFLTAAEALNALAKPAFEMTFTGHPTNTNSVASMEKQRVLAAALMQIGAEPSVAKKALLDFAQSPLLPMKDGKATPLTVPEETETMLYFLGNAYDDLPGTYATFDRELTDAYGANYDAQRLKLGYQFHSWGSSGDKDGNKKINADTTLSAVAMHRAAIVARYATELEALGLPRAVPMRAAATTLARLSQEINAILKNKDPLKAYLDAPQFEAFSAQLREATAGLDATELAKTLETACAQAPSDDVKQKTLNLLRRVRTFGLGFGHIEYRETAEEYERVVAALVPEYAALLTPLIRMRRERAVLLEPLEGLQNEYAAALAKSDTVQQEILVKKIESLKEQLTPLVEKAEEQIAAVKTQIEPGRQALLTELLKHPAKLTGRTQKLQATLSAAAGKAYADNNALPITYQTLKRMELARDFPDMIQNNVLAECNGTSNMLEALVLQHDSSQGWQTCDHGDRAIV